MVFFIASIFVSPSTCKVDAIKSFDLEEVDDFDKLYGFEHFNKYNVSEITPEDWEFYYSYSLDQSGDILKTLKQKYFDTDDQSSKITSIASRGGLMDSPWSMYCHDVHHTGRSPYSTIDTWDEIWRFKQHVNDYVRGSPIIGDDGTIYFGAGDFYALYPNGTLKWKYDDLNYYVWSAPAIDDSSVIYVGDRDGYFYAINSDGTEKWSYRVGNEILSSPTIGDDGTIYFGNVIYPTDGYIYALYPNGTLKWRYKTDLVVYSSPAIGSDGTVYCGSHDTYLYALYPNNGTLKWKYKTDGWIRTSPCIGDDGTIYVVSLDSYLHAVNPDGTQKWKTDVGAGTSPTIGQDGTIYAGYGILHAVNPSNGSVKWTFDVGGTIQGSTPCHSAEDIIYFGTHLTDYAGGGDFVAVNPDGTERWRKGIANHYIDSAPAIGEDGRVYVGSAWEISGYSRGYLHAFGIGPLEAEADGPYYGLINEPVQFKGKASGGYSPYVSYHWSFGDGGSSNEQNPTHTYTSAENYTVTLTVTDNTGNTSTDTTFAWIQVTNDPPNKPSISGPTHGHFFEYYEYTFSATDPEGTPVWYYIDWDGPHGDTGWIGPSASGGEVVAGHWWGRGTYTIRCKAKDPYGEEGPWGTLKVKMPINIQINQQSSNQLLLKMFQRLLLNIR
jgi:outer membrane protein assembly factor BamB